MNATAIAFDREGQMYVSSRHDEPSTKSPRRTMSTYAEGMGSPPESPSIATRIFMSDRSGTIFKIARDRQIFVFATLEPSVSAYQSLRTHGDMFVTAPAQASTASTKSTLTELFSLLRGSGTSASWPSMSRQRYVAASLAGQRAS